MLKKNSSVHDLHRQYSLQELSKILPNQSIHEGSSNRQSGSSTKDPSLGSIDHQSQLIDSYFSPNNDDHNPIEGKMQLNDSLDHAAAASDRSSITTSEQPCALTQMLLTYAQKYVETLQSSTSKRSICSFNNILNVLELHFNTYADNDRHIYFEGIFRVLHEFKEQVTEFLLTETMKLLQINPLAPCTFENFILILCHLPSVKQESNDLCVAFNSLDSNKDFYITFEDIQSVLPHLTSYFNEEIIRAAIRTIDVDHDQDRLSYFDFVTSFMLLRDFTSHAKRKQQNAENFMSFIGTKKQ